MKKNYKRLLPLLLALPALMANAPMPQVFDNEYKDYQITYVSHEPNGERYNYTYHLKNTGKGYIDYIRLFYETNDASYGFSYYSSGNYHPFSNIVFEPGFDGDIVFDSYREIPDINKLKAKCEGYSMFDESVIVGGSKAVTLANKYSGDIYYQVDLTLNYSEAKDKDFNYGAILKINYEDNIYYVKVDETQKYRIETREELDLTKLTVLDVTVIKSRPSYYGIVDVFTIIAIVVIVCLVIFIGGGIFAAIFIPTMVRRKRRRRAALLAKKQQQSK